MDIVFKYKNVTVKISYSLGSSFCQKEIVFLNSIKKENGYVIPKPYRLGIELKKNTGGRICYGFVSACIVPGVQGTINVSFEYEKELKEGILVDSIYNSSTVGEGLPNEFRKELEKSVISSLEIAKSFPWCNIYYDQFMYCEVGSSIKIYDVIIKLMSGIIRDNLQQDIMNMDIKDFINRYEYAWNDSII